MKLLVCVCLCLWALTACFALPVEEAAPPPPVLHAASAANYKTVEVKRGDVTRYIDITANYVPAQEQSLGFDIGDEYIRAVYVDIGDTVQAGDALAELDRVYFQDELEKVARDEAWARMSLAQLETDRALQLSEADITERQVDEAAYLDAAADLLTQLTAYGVRRDYLSAEAERRVLRAGLTGTVTAAPPFTEGMRSVADRNVFTIADQSLSVFMVRGADVAYMQTGQAYDMTINGESYVGILADTEKVRISRVNDDEKYLILDSDDPPALSARTFATARVVIAEARNVLYVPFSAIKRANAREFVYVLADGVRTLRDVQTGLTGNTATEIVSGLAEGDEVIQE